SNMAVHVPDNFYRGIFGTLLDSPELRQLVDSIGAGNRVVVLSGLAGSARALVLAGVEKRLQRRLVYITRSNRTVEELQPDVEFFYCALNGLDSCSDKILNIPALENDPYDGTSPHAEVLEQRTLAFHRAYEGEARILLTSIDAIAERTVSPQLLKA